MTTLTLQLPDTLESEQTETIRFLAAKLYESGKLSLGQAAGVANMSKWDFAEILSNYNVNYFQYSPDDLIDEARNII